MKTNVLAFDLGGSSGRAIIATLTNDNISLKEINRFNYSPTKDNDGHLRWDFDCIMSHIYQSLQLAQPYDISSIGIDTWGVDYGLLDKNGNLISNPFHYRDNRTEQSQEKVFEIIDKDTLYAISGIQPMRINTINQLYWDKLNALDEQAEKFAFIPDLIAYKLTGNLFAELSIASTSGLLDQNKQDWNWQLIDKLQLKRSLFAPIIINGNKYGDLKSDLCTQLNIKSIPVIAVCQHDTASAIMCSGNDNNTAYISCGTWALMGVLQDTINTSCQQFTNECGWAGKITYLNNTSGMWLIQEVRRNEIAVNGNISFEQIDDLARLSNYSGTINPNDKAFEEPCNMQEQIRKYCVEKGQLPPSTLGDIAKCIYLSQALAYKQNVELLQATLGITINTIFIFGGGSKSQLLAQTTADITGKIVKRGISEATALGNVGAQFICLNACNLQDFEKMIAKCYNVITHYPNK